MTYTQPNYTLLTDEEVIEATPFAATVMKPVFEEYPEFMSPAIYGSNDDGTEFEAIENMPRILYDASDGSPYNMGGTTFLHKMELLQQILVHILFLVIQVTFLLLLMMMIIFLVRNNQ